MDRPYKTKILRVIARLNVGGPAHQVVLLTHALNDSRWESVLVTGNPSSAEGNAEYLIRQHPCRLLRIPEMNREIHPLQDLTAAWKLFQILLREKPTILHTHTAKAGTLGRAAGIAYRLLTRRPLAMVHTFHGHVLSGYFGPWTTRLFLQIERWLAKRTGCLIAVSQAVKQELISFGIGSDSTIRVIPLGLDLQELLALPLQGTRDPGPIRVGYVGRLVPIKNPFLLLEAARQLSRQPSRSSFELLFIGDGELRPALEKKVQEMGMSGRVRFLGWRQDLAVVYRMLDILCLTSKNEGTPVSLIEALAAGTPVIATDVGGVRELLGGNLSGSEKPMCQPAPISAGTFEAFPHGILIGSNDREGLVHGLEFLCARPDIGLRMGTTGRDYVHRQFVIGRLVSDIQRLYEGLA